jgi:hypothetical protein
MSRAAICPPSRRGHSWREIRRPDGLLPHDLLALRVCKRCGEVGQISAQGIVMTTGRRIDLNEVSFHEARRS